MRINIYKDFMLINDYTENQAKYLENMCDRFGLTINRNGMAFIMIKGKLSGLYELLVDITNGFDYYEIL